jgi:CRISPR-associated protein Csy2
MVTETETEAPPSRALLILPHVRVQNANTISSPMTWGFPAITAFTGLMTALKRRLGQDAGIEFYGVGVICHHFEPQVTQAGYTRSFHLTRNPVSSDGSTAAIVEEGRAHLDITLVFAVALTGTPLSEGERAQLAAQIGELVAGMRIAGGSVMPPLLASPQRPARTHLRLMPDDDGERLKQFRRLSRRWLPGFALVSRDGLLQTRLAALRERDPQASALDAWLDLSRLNHRAERRTSVDDRTGDATESIVWQTDQRPGWIVPMPVGYAALSELHDAGSVAGARDGRVPFRFVESVYSLGQWISPHRLNDVTDLIWSPMYDAKTGLYRCVNEFQGV